MLEKKPATFLFAVKLYTTEPVRVNDHDYEAMVLLESPQAREIHTYRYTWPQCRRVPKQGRAIGMRRKLPPYRQISRFPKYNV